MSTLSEAIATEFRRILVDRQLSVSAAAREIRVTRQAFHRYLNGKSVPRHKTLGLAMDLWGFKLEIAGVPLDRASLGTDENSQTPKQLLLWETLDSIKQQDLKISVRREGSTFNVDVRIEIPA
jgi:hypothetical protein